jgi:hypothetical protein
MKRIRLVFTGAVGAVLLAFLFSGCGQPTGQGTEDRAPRASVISASPVEAKSAAELADGHSNGPVALALSGETKPEEIPQQGRPGELGTLTLSAEPPPVEALASAGASTRGLVLLPDGMTYDGEMSDGKPNGHGTVTGPNGTQQQGEWRDGEVRRLSGKWVAPDGTIEVGTWNRDGTPSGGTITWTDGRKYKGDWKIVEGALELPDGRGEMRWPDGRIYVGRFRDGTMEGMGKMTYPDGKSELGLWKQGKLVEAVQ